MVGLMNGTYRDAMATSDELTSRRVVARLIQRLGFGTKPGEFQAFLSLGVDGVVEKFLSSPATGTPEGIKDQLGLMDLGARPRPNTPEVVTYSEQKRYMTREMSLWWLERMTITDFPLEERMTWFWHGHWATSFAKVDEPIVMFDHVAKLRDHSLGDFNKMARIMVLDGALIFWLDGQRNTSASPNENLARELLELFTLGVNRYSEDDVKQAALALSGYTVKKSSGEVLRNSRRSFMGRTTILGKSAAFDAISLTDHLVAQDSCQRFIPERLWYRFISTRHQLPMQSTIVDAFASRSIKDTLQSLINDPGFIDPAHSQVKSPLEWLIGSMRALTIRPTTFVRPDYLLNLLQQLGQRPFLPPNVGGWPADEAWLSSAAIQSKIQAAQLLAREGDLSPIEDVPIRGRVDALADLLGIPAWQEESRRVLQSARNSPQRLVTLALCSPEFLVSN
jgi:uncharacterized protein (DUF1800 family)